MHRLADLSTHYGSGELRLTVWQNLLIPNVPDAFVGTVQRALYSLGLHTEPSSATGGVIACTGNQGCKYSATDTKGHAVALARALQEKPLDLGQPINIHFTGCPNSCAQHYVGDIGLLGAKHSDGSEAYHVMLGGGVGDDQGLAREIFRGVRAEELNGLVKKILAVFVARREPGESFNHWARRHAVGELQELLSN
jgi:ferredoxin-nitrite reductase